jgi:hypothetical protein
MRLVRPILAVGLMASGVGACSMAQLDDRGSKVVVIDKPYEGCEYVSTAYGRSFFEENALNNLRDQVGADGATHLVLTAETQVGGPVLPASGNSLTAHGIGYRCPATLVQAGPRRK